MAQPSITRLGFALLGLIDQQPRSGYGLRRVFADTPMGSYSSSPGSIYPALKALERQDFVTRRAEAGTRPVYRLTGRGQAVLDGWLAAPADAAEIVRHLDLALLRFAFLSGRDDRQATGRFLEDFHRALRAHADALRAFLDGSEGKALPLQPRLAVEHGLRSAEASAAWAADARTCLGFGQIMEAKGRV